MVYSSGGCQRGPWMETLYPGQAGIVTFNGDNYLSLSGQYFADEQWEKPSIGARDEQQLQKQFSHQKCCLQTND